MSIQPYLDTYLTRHGVSLDTSSDRELMYALTAAVRDLQKPMGHAQGKRKLYYFSAEFLVGRLLRANLINLGLLEDVEALLAAHGRSLAQIEDQEPEPSLGNGGLGRLAACFLDSIASLGINGTVWASITTMACSVSGWTLAGRLRCPTPGLRRSPGCWIPGCPTR